MDLPPNTSRNNTGRRRFAAVIGWLISALFLTLALLNIDLAGFVAAISKISALDIFFLVAIYLAGFVARGIRSTVLLPNLSFRQALGGVFVGYAANNLLPARLGEFVRAQVVGRGTNMSRTTVLSSIFVERVLDGFVIVLLLIVGTVSDTLPGWVHTLKWSAMALFGSLLVVILCAGRFEEFIMKRLKHGLTRELTAKFLAGFALSTRKTTTLPLVLIYSFATWIIEGLMFVYALPAFDLALPWLCGFFALGVINLGVLIPSSPGNLGVFQYFAILALSVFGVAKSGALAYAVVIHGCQYIPTTFIGIVCLRYFGFKSLVEIQRSSANDPT